MDLMNSVLVALGGTGVFLAVVAFLGRSLIKHWLDKDLGKFKIDLQHTAAQELETLKSHLHMAANEHSILLTKLQERRAEVIGELYGQISKGVRELISYLRPLQLAGEENRTEKAAAARTALMTALHSFEDKRVWLPVECADGTAAFLEELRQMFNRYDILRQSAERRPHDGAQEREMEAWMMAWARLSGDEFIATRRSLEDEMRKLLEPRRVAQQ